MAVLAGALPEEAVKRETYVIQIPFKWVKSVEQYQREYGLGVGVRRDWLWNLNWWKAAYRVRR